MPTSTSTSAESSGSNVPAFLSKLWRLVEDPKYDSVISWSNSGQSFTIHDQTQFAKEVLPLYFKHNNMASFIRQLNMYGFRKVVNVDSGGLKGYKEDIEFYHNCFIRGQESTLEYIKRKAPSHQKIPSTTTPAISAVPHDQELRTELVRELLTDVNQLQGKQEKVDSQLVEMKRENEALWREVAVLRRKHLKQQQIVEKLIHFLARLVHQARAGNTDNNISMKRKHTLMLDEGVKMRKTLKGTVGPTRQKEVFKQNQAFQATQPESRISDIDSGPIISDITYEQSMNEQRFHNIPSSGAKNKALTIAAPDTAPSPITEALISSPASASDLADEVVLCENLFDEEVDLAPCVEAAVSNNRNSFQTPTQPAQPFSGKQQVRDSGKFDLDQTLNTPRVDWTAEDQNLIPGTSSKQLSSGQLTTSGASAVAAPGMEVALQTSNKNTFKAESPNSKNKDALEESKPSYSEDSPSRLDSKAVAEWQGGRNALAHKLSSMLTDNLFKGAEQIKRIAEDTNKPPETLNDHLEGVETELDWLQQQLTAGGLNIDNNTLFNIFNTDMANFGDDNSSANANSQVVQYQDSSFFDLMDDVVENEDSRKPWESTSGRL